MTATAVSKRATIGRVIGFELVLDPNGENQIETFDNREDMFNRAKDIRSFGEVMKMIGAPEDETKEIEIHFYGQIELTDGSINRCDYSTAEVGDLAIRLSDGSRQYSQWLLFKNLPKVSH